MLNPNKRGVSPVIAIVLLLMMTVAAAGAAYFWLTRMQSRMQKRSTESIESIMQQTGRRVIGEAVICKPIRDDWKLKRGHSYKVFGTDKNWKGARDSCNDYKTGYFTVVSSPEENDYLKGIAGDNSWIGYYQDSDDLSDNNGYPEGCGNEPEGCWKWEVFPEKSSYTNWYSGEPNNAGGSENCTVMYDDGGWNDASCGGSKNYICEAGVDVQVTVRNIGTKEIPKAKWVASLKKEGTTLEQDAYKTNSTIGENELAKLHFYFTEIKGREEYTISIPGIGVSKTVKCQSLE